jgi:hypothetical protein
MYHDQLFKQLLTTYFWEFVELFLPGMTRYLDRDSIEFVDKEVFTDLAVGEKHEADVVVKARFRGESAFFLVHVENQASAQHGFARRMFRYFSVLHGRHNLPVYPVAILSFDQPLRPEPDHYVVEFPDFHVLDFRFRAIQLNQLDWREFVRHPNPVAAALMSKMKIAKKDRPRAKLACLRMIATLNLGPAGRDLLSGIVDTYLPLDSAEENAFGESLEQAGLMEKEGVMEIVTSWMERGRNEGRREGRQEGRQALAEAVEIFLRRQLGDVRSDQAARVAGLPLERLEALSRELVDFTTSADLDAWLARED